MGLLVPLGTAVCFADGGLHALLDLVRLCHDLLHLMGTTVIAVDDRVIVLAIQFNQIWKYLHKVNEQPLSQVFNIIAREFQSNNQLLARNSVKLINLLQTIASNIQLLQLFKLLYSLQRCHGTMSQGQRPHSSILLMQIINFQSFFGKAKRDAGGEGIEGGLSCCEVIRKHNEIIIAHCIKMDKDRFLSLCDPHNSIIHQFGCEGSCTRPAAICLKGCNQYQHQQKASKHEFMPAKELYTVVGSVREKYSSFKANFRDVYLKRYIDEVMACVESFETYILGEFLQKNPMIDIFCKYSSAGDLFQQAIEDPLDELEFAELKCRQVFHLRHFQQMLQRQGPQEQEKRMIRLLSKIFQYHLRSQKILLPQKGPTERKMRNQELLELDRIEALPQALNRKITNLQYSQRQEKVQELLLLLRSEMKEFQRYSQNVDFVGKTFNSLQSYMQRVQPQKLILAVNFPLSPCPLWDKFTQFITNKGLKQVAIYTTTDQNPSTAQYQAQLFKRHENSLSITIQHSSKWEQISTLIDKRPDR